MYIEQQYLLRFSDFINDVSLILSKIDNEISVPDSPQDTSEKRTFNYIKNRKNTLNITNMTNSADDNDYIEDESDHNIEEIKKLFNYKKKYPNSINSVKLKSDKLTNLEQSVLDSFNKYFDTKNLNNIDYINILTLIEYISEKNTIDHFQLYKQISIIIERGINNFLLNEFSKNFNSTYSDSHIYLTYKSLKDIRIIAININIKFQLCFRRCVQYDFITIIQKKYDVEKSWESLFDSLITGEELITIHKKINIVKNSLMKLNNISDTEPELISEQDILDTLGIETNDKEQTYLTHMCYIIDLKKKSNAQFYKSIIDMFQITE
ncbi:MAG: hypothetical protein Terrestrivirus5_163 [Terrestrivirus sp.]|uniref:Uncharacterized protein n=1 Tax=Terrestrivirus sp. TaxID=2487775 RepID=A0A3G4ZQS5_9VIRU|nr:MAG: hypothetical protein Terrestrivirus5_163 [Terrestrivirus sp.]